MRRTVFVSYCFRFKEKFEVNRKTYPPVRCGRKCAKCPSLVGNFHRRNYVSLLTSLFTSVATGSKLWGFSVFCKEIEAFFNLQFLRNQRQRDPNLQNFPQGSETSRESTAFDLKVVSIECRLTLAHCYIDTLICSASHFAMNVEQMSSSFTA